MEASLDTNVLARFALKDIPDQFADAIALLSTPGARFHVADEAFIELAFVLEHHYTMDRSQIVTVIRALLTIDALVAHRATLEATCALFLDHPKLAFTDLLPRRVRPPGRRSPAVHLRPEVGRPVRDRRAGSSRRLRVTRSAVRRLIAITPR